MERDPAKRRVKPSQTLIDFDDLGESSDDSDFRIEDHCDESDLDDSMDSDDANKQDESEAESEDDSDESEEDELGEKLTVEDVLIQAQQRQQYSEDLVQPVKVMICCVCLGDRSDAANEIVECDGCGVTVHEGCYGVSENDSVSSTVSSCSTMPWFCEACRAGIDNPTCELCPNSGGIFKETDVGKWVHLVCALYIPGVAFGEVDKLASVTLFEMAYSKWGAKACQFCPDQRFTRTGVAIGCDAGMCRTFFHVTCGQREGLLSEAHSEEVDQADPFYAHCKLHSDKTLMRKRRRNWLALELRTAQRKKEYESEGHKDLPEQQRIQRKLGKYRSKYATGKITKPSPWVPTQKMARMLTSSASACRALWRKAELSGVDTEAWALREAQAAALADVHRKWHIPPAFSVEFIGYYLDRNARMETMRRQLSELLDENGKLRDDQKNLQIAYDEINKENAEEVAINTKLKSLAQKYHELILAMAPNKKLPSLETLGNPITSTPTVLMASHPRHPLATSTGGVPTAAALKAGVGFPLGLRRQESAPLALNNECGICHRTTDQHLLAKCDTCYLYYHLGCLNPPLTRMPKKTKLMGWQCSECDKESSGSEVECIDPEAPRKLRTPKENNGDTSGPVTPTSFVAPVSLPDIKTDPNTESLEEQLSSPVLTMAEDSVDHSGRSNKKRRREKHHRYSPEPSGSSQVARSHKRKRKRKSQDSPKEGEHRPALKICQTSDPSNLIKTNTALSQPETHSSFAATIPNCRSQSVTKPCVSHDQNQPKCHISLALNQSSEQTLVAQSVANNKNTFELITINKNKINSVRSQSNNKGSSHEKRQFNYSLLDKKQCDEHSVDHLENSSTISSNISSINHKLPNNCSSYDKKQNLNNHSLENSHINNSFSEYNQLINSPLTINEPDGNTPVSFGQNQSDNQKKISHSQSLQQPNNTVLHSQNQLDNQNPADQNIHDNHSSAYVYNNFTLSQSQPDHHIPTDQNLTDTHPSRNVANFLPLGQNHLYNQMLNKNLSANISSLPLSNNIFSHNQRQSNQNHSSYNQNMLYNFASSPHILPIHGPTQDHNTANNISTSDNNSLTHGISEHADHFSSLGLLNSLFYPQSPYSVHYPAPYNLHPDQLNRISMNHCLNSCLHGPPAFSPQPFPTSRHPACGVFKSIPHPTGEGSAYVATPGGGVYQASTPRPMFVTSHPVVPRVQAATPRPPAQIIQRVIPQTATMPRVSTGMSKKPKESEKPILCDTCNTLGTNANLVRCDECMKGFHFSCLDPPVKKSPKVRGYSWHCANCDPTESDSS